MTTLYEFQDPLKLNPDFGVFSKDQSMCLLATKDQSIIVNIKSGNETDLEDVEGIQAVKSCISDDKYFYILANKKDQELGYYFFKIPFNDLDDVQYLININSKLLIGDCSIARYEDDHVEDY